MTDDKQCSIAEVRLAVREEVRVAVRDEMSTILGHVGIDVGDPQESRLDFAHLRRSRKVFGHAMLTGIGAIVLGLIGVTWAGVQRLLDGS